jgi:hypothetical protein
LPPLSLVIPQPMDLLVLLLVWATGAVFFLAGRLLTRGRGLPELQFLAGWGAYCVLLTVWGLATGASMRIPALAFVAVAATALLGRDSRPTRADLASLARLLLLGLPMWLILAGARPALPDTFTNFLPNAVYVFDHGTFPADDRIANISVWPALPYNLSLVGLLPSLPLADFPPAVLVLFNVLLYAACGLLIARLLQPERPVPAWPAIAAGLLLATGINPGYVPKYDFSAYGDGATAVAFAAGGWLAVRLLAALAGGKDHRALGLLYGLVLAALVNIKESDIALTGILFVVPLLLAALDRGIGWRRALSVLLLYGLPAAVVYGAWRIYVTTRLPGGELNLLPFADWHLQVLPLVLRGMLRVAVQKVYMTAAVAAVLWLAWRSRRDTGESARLLQLGALAFLLYNGFLLFTYVAHFDAPADADAHSYFRYMTHLSLLVVMALVAVGRDGWVKRGKPRLPRFVPAAFVLLTLLVPAALVSWLRFDLQMPYPLLQRIAAEAAGLLPDGARVALLLPGDNGSLGVLLKAELTLLPPRRPALILADETAIDAGSLDQAAQAGYRFTFVSCTPDYWAGVPPGHAALLEHASAGWRILKLWDYPETRRRARWTPAVAGEPLCRSS